VTILAFLGGCIVGVLAGAIIMAVLCAAGNSDGYVQISPDVDEGPETASLRQQLAETRHHLSACQAAAEQQRQRADVYFDLYCAGAKANAALRREHV
jgi:hypothetical protein